MIESGNDLDKEEVKAPLQKHRSCKEMITLLETIRDGKTDTGTEFDYKTVKVEA